MNLLELKQMIEAILGFVGGSAFTASIMYRRWNKKPQKSEKDLFVQELIDGVKDGTLKVEKLDVSGGFNFTKQIKTSYSFQIKLDNENFVQIYSNTDNKCWGIVVGPVNELGWAINADQDLESELFQICKIPHDFKKLTESVKLMNYESMKQKVRDMENELGV